MTYAIAWSHAARWKFYELHPHTAMIVDRAVIRFAERGEGEITREGPYYHLRAGKYELVLAVVPAEQQITVLHIRAYRAPR